MEKKTIHEKLEKAFPVMQKSGWQQDAESRQQDIVNFTEDAASEIAEKNGISKTVVAVWRSRGKIPKKYFEKDYKKEAKIDKKEEFKVDKVVAILAKRKINISALERRVGFSLLDFIRKKTKPTSSQIDAISIEIKQAAIAVKNLLQMLNGSGYHRKETIDRYRAFLKNDIYVHFVIFNRNRGLQSKNYWVKNSDTAAFPSEFIDFIRQSFIEFVLEHTI